MADMLTLTEENYLKSIYHLSGSGQDSVMTNSLAEAMATKPASVTDMIKRLSGKGLITYEKYHGVNITKRGKVVALDIVRKHRLWETFLVNKLGFSWDEVHPVAEQLEHIDSPLLIQKLDEFLGFPKHDPHGHPIPDAQGNVPKQHQVVLSDLPLLTPATVVAVKNGTPSFLQYLSKMGIYIGATIRILEKVEFDGSLEVELDRHAAKKMFISKEAAMHLLVTP
jgi:DtxR family Mn-dependent transcriptional regulator